MALFESTRLKTPERSANWLGRLTIADGLFALVVFLGGIIRFTNLGQIPLSELEADMAWSVWRFWQPGSAAITVSSPAYFTFTSLLTPLVGFNDATVRLVPALFGLGVVCLPWLLAHRLGHVGALVACGFLAMSPLNVAISRAVGGEAIALFAVLLILVAFVRSQETDDRRWLYVLMGALGLGLASAPLFYSGLLTLALSLFTAAKMGLRLVDGDSYIWPEVGVRKTAVLVALGVFAVSSSFLLWHPAGFGAAAQMAGSWFGQFGGGSDPGVSRALVDPFLALARYELGLVIMGVVAVLWVLWRSHAWGLAFVYWVLAGLLLMLVQAGEMPNTLILTLPGYLLMGHLTGFLLSGKTARGIVWGVAALLFTLCMLIIINTGRFLRVVVYDPQNIQYLLTIMLGFVLAAMLLYLLLTVDITAVGQGVWLGLLIFFAIVAWGTGWWLGHQAANDPRERWVMTATDTDIRLLVDNLHTLSMQFANSSTGIDMAVSVDTAVVRWYLREFKQAEIGQTLPATASHRVLITPEQAAPPLDDAYTGEDYGLTLSKSPNEQAPLNVNKVMETLRWWFFHDTAASASNGRVILWVRADLGNRQQ